jgi:hypothetical protein
MAFKQNGREKVHSGMRVLLIFVTIDGAPLCH